MAGDILSEDDAKAIIRSIVPSAVWGPRSGFRTQGENAAVRGVQGSLHTRGGGQALDFNVPGHQWTQSELNELKSRFDQLGVPHTELMIDTAAGPHSTGPHIHWGWGPKGTMAAASQPAQNDPYAGMDSLPDAFSAALTAKPQAKEDIYKSMDGLPDAFSAALRSGGSAKPTSASATSAPPVKTAQTPAGGATTALGRGADAIANAFDNYIQKPQEAFNRGATQGVRDVAASLDPAAQFLERHLGTYTLGGLLPTAEQAHQSNVAARNAFEASQPGVPEELGRAGGQVVGTLPLFEVGGMGLAGVKNAIPAAAPVLDFLGGASRTGNRLIDYASRAIGGAGQGALAGAATSGASDQPFVDQVTQGAELGATLGAGVPLAIATGRYARNATNALVRPFTQTGREATAADIIQKFAGGPVKVNAGQIVPGSEPTLAEATGNPGIAQLQRTLQNINPHSPLLAREAENQAARQAHIAGTTGGPQDIEAAIRARDTATSRQRNAVFAPGNVKPADITPVKAAIDATLAGPSGSRPAIERAMDDVKAMLTDRNGKDITDPNKLYKSVRDGINDLIDGKDLTKGYGKQAARELIAIRDTLDSTIDAAAPGFKGYLQAYNVASLPIDAMKYLQGLNLTDTQGNFTLAKVQKAISDLDKQASAAGIKPGKTVSTQQRNALVSLRDDLLRRNQGVGGGKAIGSNTAQNIAAEHQLQQILPGKIGAFAGKINPEVIGAGAGYGLGHVLTGNPYIADLAAMTGAGLGNVVSHGSAQRNALIQQEIENLLLNPSRYSAVAPKPNAPSGVVNLLTSGGGRHVVPLAVIGKNRLLAD